MWEDKFRYLDHMTDLIVEAQGKNLEEMFQNSALGLVNAMFDISKVDKTHSITIKAEGHDLESLLYDWLEKIILVTYVDKIIITGFDYFQLFKIYDNEKMITGENNSNKKGLESENREINDKNTISLLNNADDDIDGYHSQIYKIECICKGEPLDIKKHEYKVEAKAPTYHEMKINRDESGIYVAKFLIDL